MPPRREAHPPGPCAMVIFGAGGDLTKRLLFPALYNLARTKLLPENFAIVGVGHRRPLRRGLAQLSLLDMLQGFVGNPASESHLDAIDQAVWDKLSRSMSYVQGDLTIPTCTTSLASTWKRSPSSKQHRRQRAVLPRDRRPLLRHRGRNLGASRAHRRMRGRQAVRWRRVVIEKPFGHDLESAKELNAKVL